MATSSRTVRVFAPATIGNIGPGLDILGLAVTGPGDEVVASLVDRPGVHIASAGHHNLPTDPALHTSGIAATEVLRLAGAPDIGIELSVTKGIPLSGGQGGSTASAVAAAVATNTLLGSPLSAANLMAASLVADAKVAGRHLDNIAPCLLGGCVLVRSVEEYHVYRIPTPPDLRVILAHPHQLMRTSEGRAVLPKTVDRDVAMTQAAHVAALVAAFTLKDDTLLASSIQDLIAEPARAPLLPGFLAAKAAALAAGALGCSISGSGPTAFAFARDETAPRIAHAMHTAYTALGIGADVHVGSVDPTGARLMEME